MIRKFPVCLNSSGSTAASPQGAPKEYMQQEAEATGSLARQGRAGNGPRRVAEAMTRETVTLAPEQSFAEAVTMMATQPFRHLLVVDSERRLCRVISDRDVLRALARTADWNTKTVSEIMTRDPISVAPEAAISPALRAMLDKRIDCLPVIDPDGRACSILTSTDLLHAYEKIQSALERGADPA
jgi:CBS domain-containing protein